MGVLGLQDLQEQSWRDNRHIGNVIQTRIRPMQGRYAALPPPQNSQQLRLQKLYNQNGSLAENRDEQHE